MNINDELVIASRNGDLKNVCRLINEGADVHYECDEALIVAAGNGHIKILSVLLEADADLHVNNDEAFRSAVDNEHYRLVRYMLDKGVSANTNDEYLLKSAIERGHLEIVKMAIEYGADVRSEYEHPLYLAARGGHVKIVKYLLEECEIHGGVNNSSALAIASEKGNTKIVELLLANGANPRAYFSEALRYADNNGHIGIVRILLDKGADSLQLRDSTKMLLGITMFDWVKKPRRKPAFRRNSECPISYVKLSGRIEKLGCSKCLSVFERSALEKWLVKNFSCPLCRNDEFYLA